MRNPVLLAALSLITLGMALVVIGVISPGLFTAGVYLLDAGMLALGVAGIMHIVPARAPA